MEAAIQIPPLPTRLEIVAYCNELWPERPKPVTVKMVRRWEEEKWIRPHPAHRKPARYVASSVLNFLEGQF